MRIFYGVVIFFVILVVFNVNDGNDPPTTVQPSNGYQEAVRQSKEDPVGHAKAEDCYLRGYREAQALNETYVRENPGQSLNIKKVTQARYQLCMANFTTP